MHVSLLSMCRCADVKQLSFRVGVGGGGNYSALVWRGKFQRRSTLSDSCWPCLCNERPGRPVTCLAGKQSPACNVLSAEHVSWDVSNTRHDGAPLCVNIRLGLLSRNHWKNVKHSRYFHCLRGTGLFKRTEMTKTPWTPQFWELQRHFSTQMRWFVFQRWIWVYMTQ